MRKMKDSGIEWIGEIPENWNICQLRRVCSGFNNGSSATQISKITNYPVSRIETISRGFVDLSKVGYVVDISKRFLLEKGDILVSNINSIPYLGNCAIIEDEYLFHGMNLMLVKPVKIHDRYLYYFFKSEAFRESMRMFCKPAINQASVSASTVKSLPILVLELDEQTKIADFLDKKCSKIDKAIAYQEKLIEKLKEYKQSLITETVTKGLDPNAKMKDSGIEWIGKIPESWKVSRIKNIFNFDKGLSITKADLKDSGFPVISYGQIHSKSNCGVHVKNELIRYVDSQCINNRKPLKIGSFIFADTSEDKDGCGNFVYIDKDKDIYAGYHTISLIPSRSYLDNKFLAYLFQSDAFRKQIRQVTQGVKTYSISKKILSTCSLIYPDSAKEQELIVEYLDNACLKIDNAINTHEQLTEKLQEYKKSLIYEYVTGKKEVV